MDPDPGIHCLGLTDPESDPDPAIFVSDLQDAYKKLLFSKVFFAYYFFKVSFFKDKKSKRSHKTVGIKIFLTIFA